jgi:GNAT superfamily N-acetyltransferase
MIPAARPPATLASTDRRPDPRLAAAADLPAIRRLNAAAYSRYADRMDEPPAPVRHDYSAEVTAGHVWLVDEPGTGAVAVIVLVPAGESLLIENIAVLPAAQGTGIGRGLMEFAERRARALGLPGLTLYTNDVMVENLAIYARLGYREVGRRTQDGYRRVFMAKSLTDMGPDRTNQGDDLSSQCMIPATLVAAPLTSSNLAMISGSAS